MPAPARLRCRLAHRGITVYTPVQAGVVGADILWYSKSVLFDTIIGSYRHVTLRGPMRFASR